MEKEEVAADTTSSLSQLKGKPVRFKLNYLKMDCMCLCVDCLREEKNDFEKLVFVSIIRRLPAHSLVTPGLHTCVEISACVI